METIIGYLQAQRDSTSNNPGTAIVTSATTMTTSVSDVVTTVETPVKKVVQPTVNQLIFPSTPSRLVAAYP